MKSVVILFALTFIPSIVFGQVINEVMYDTSGGDTGREWIEIWNNSSNAIDLSSWKIREGTSNHSLVIFSGDSLIPAGGYMVIADNPDKFKLDWPDYTGVIFDSSFSLSNTGETLILRDPDLNDVDTLTYTSDWGASGDGNSLQKMGSSWSASLPTPGEVNNSSSSEENNPPKDTSGGGSAIETNQSPSYFIIEPQVFAEARIESETVVSGAQFFVYGSAYGLEKKPLANARYYWNFGDGTVSEVQNPVHTYYYPGEYIIVLNISSDKYSATDRLKVRAIESPVVVSKVELGDKGLIEISNKYGSELDLSGWVIRSGSFAFIIPKNTIIGANGKLLISASNLGESINLPVSIMYPNEKVAYSYEGFVKKEIANVYSSNDAPQSKVVNISESVKTSPDLLKQSANVALASNDTSLNVDNQSVDDTKSIPEEQNSDSKGSYWWWVLACFGLLIISVASVFLIKSPQSSLADEITIVE